MNNTDKGKFQIGNEVAKGKTGRKHLKTLVRESLQKSINDFDNRLYELSESFLNDKNKAVRFSAWKELLKYRLVKSKEFKDNTHWTIEDVLEEAKKLRDKNFELKLKELKELKENNNLELLN